MKKTSLFILISLFSSLGYSTESELCNSIHKMNDKILKLSLSVNKETSNLSLDFPTPWGIRSSKYNINQVDCRDSKNIKIYSSSNNGGSMILQMTPQRADSAYQGIVLQTNGHTSYINWKCPLKNISALCD